MEWSAPAATPDRASGDFADDGSAVSIHRVFFLGTQIMAP